MSAAFVAGVVAGYGVAIPVGAVGVLIVGLSARTSLRVGAAAGLGAATADGLYAVAAVAGGAVVAEVIAPMTEPLRWVAAIVLAGLAVLTVRGAFRKSDDTSAERLATGLRAYLGVLGITLLNPTTVVYFVALVLGGAAQGGGIWFVVGAFVASASWQLLLAGGGSLIGRVLTGERGRVVTALASGVVIFVLAVVLVLP